jgi:hypothetical protein
VSRRDPGKGVMEPIGLRARYQRNQPRGHAWKPCQLGASGTLRISHCLQSTYRPTSTSARGCAAVNTGTKANILPASGASLRVGGRGVLLPPSPVTRSPVLHLAMMAWAHPASRYPAVSPRGGLAIGRCDWKWLGTLTVLRIEMRCLGIVSSWEGNVARAARVVRSTLHRGRSEGRLGPSPLI